MPSYCLRLSFFCLECLSARIKRFCMKEFINGINFSSSNDLPCGGSWYGYLSASQTIYPYYTKQPRSSEIKETKVGPSPCKPMGNQIGVKPRIQYFRSLKRKIVPDDKFS